MEHKRNTLQSLMFDASNRIYADNSCKSCLYDCQALLPTEFLQLIYVTFRPFSHHKNSAHNPYDIQALNGGSVPGGGCAVVTSTWGTAVQ